jgi:hypothetical protein
MTIGTLIGVVLALFTTAAAILHLRGRSTPRPTAGRVLRLLAAAATVGIAILALPASLNDGAFAASLVLAPVLPAAAAVVADVTGKAVGTTTTIAAILMLGWGVFLASFQTPLFVFPALLLGVAALLSIRPVTRRETNGDSRHSVTS